jgi:hypothetical protein
VSKYWAFSVGGRPVIYQPDQEYDLLPESHRWRHARYEPQTEPPTDFTWERERRIRIDELPLPPGEARIIVPHASWTQVLEHEHDVSEQHRIHMEAMYYGQEHLMQSPAPFQYGYSVINV